MRAWHPRHSMQDDHSVVHTLACTPQCSSSGLGAWQAGDRAGRLDSRRAVKRAVGWAVGRGARQAGR